MNRPFDQQVLFKREARRQINDLKNLIWCFDSLQSAHAHAGLLKKYINEPNDWALSAFSRAVISEYAKPFVSSRNLDSRKGVSTKYLTKHDEFSSEIHSMILEMRNNIVAHSDAEIEGQELQILMASFQSHPNRKSKVPYVYLPVQLLLNSKSFWYLSDENTASKIEEHCGKCVSITNDEIKRRSETLQQLLIENGQWANELDAAYVYPANENNQVEGIKQSVISIADSQKDLKIGEANVRSKITQFEHAASESAVWNCDGYKVKRELKDGKIQFLVTFDDIT